MYGLMGEGASLVGSLLNLSDTHGSTIRGASEVREYALLANGLEIRKRDLEFQTLSGEGHRAHQIGSEH